jgi:transposase
MVQVQAGNRVKTDSRDARKLARFLRSGDLTAVHVPEEATEAMRDLERAREDAKKAEQVARHQLQKFLLRHGRRYDGGCSWMQKHLGWIRGQVFEEEAQRRVLSWTTCTRWRKRGGAWSVSARTSAGWWTPGRRRRW